MPLLKDILVNVDVLKITGSDSMQVTNLCIDSRKVGTGSVFIAVKGTTVDGHAFIEKAVSDGAGVIVCEILPEIKDGVVYVQVKNSAVAAGRMADAYYGFPSSALKVV